MLAKTNKTTEYLHRFEIGRTEVDLTATDDNGNLLLTWTREDSGELSRPSQSSLQVPAEAIDKLIVYLQAMKSRAHVIDRGVRIKARPSPRLGMVDAIKAVRRVFDVPLKVAHDLVHRERVISCSPAQLRALEDERARFSEPCFDIEVIAP
jgi:hypothetical protein